MQRAAARLLTCLCGVLIGAAGCFQSACSSAVGSKEAVSGVPAPPRVGLFEDDVPDGFIEMKVLGVLPTADGNAVFLVDEEQEKVLPIWIGPSEAMAIQLRSERRRFERPLTHDLLDAMLEEMGGTVVRVHVDDMKGSTFVATVFVRTDDRVFALDARPSDGIALAAGSEAPIFVAVEVVERAGLSADGLPKERFEVPSRAMQ